MVKSIETGVTLERWGFQVQALQNAPPTSDENRSTASNNMPSSSAEVFTKTNKEITQEIQAIIRQITASVTFLPLLNEPCCFDLLVYADKDTAVPGSWGDTDPCLILNGENVALRSFSTKVLLP